jgi:hypothetical protein
MEELEKLFETELNEIQDAAVLYFQRFIKERGLVLTNELHEQFKKSVIVVASELYAEVKISFHHYGRFLDLKTMQFKGGKPDPEGALIEGLKKFIAFKGLSDFNGIPGYYGAKRMPITSVAINRLAYAMAYNRVNRGTVRRRGDGWYNKGRSMFVRDVRRRMQGSIAELITAEIAKKMEMEI